MFPSFSLGLYTDSATSVCGKGVDVSVAVPVLTGRGDRGEYISSSLLVKACHHLVGQPVSLTLSVAKQ